MPPSADEAHPEDISAANFPGFKCFQKCQAHCLNGCFAQMEPVRSKEHKIAAKALAAEVDEFAKVAEEQVGSSTGGATGGGGSGSVENSGGATGGSAASKVELASFLKEVSAREDSIATEAREADAMADENVNVAR